MGYCIASDVRLVVETALTDQEIEGVIEMSDAEIDRRIGSQSGSDNLVKKLSVLLTARSIKARQPQAQAIGEYREESGGVLEAWGEEIEGMFNLKKTVRVTGSEYGHIDERKRYPEAS